MRSNYPCHWLQPICVQACRSARAQKLTAVRDKPRRYRLARRSEFSPTKVWEGEPPGEPNLSARCEVRSAIVKHGNFSAAQEHCPPPNSLYTIRHSLIAIRRHFWLGRSLALPIFPVPRPTTPVPFLSRRSCFFVINYGLKPVA